MSLYRRARLLLKVSVGAALAPAEDPRQGFAFAYQSQRELLAKVQESLLAIRASGQRLEARAAEARELLPKLEDQARAAVVSGREELARLALRHRHTTLSQLALLEAQGREIEREEAGLSLIEQRLATQIESFYARQEVIAARFSAAEAQVRINEALTGVSQELSDLGLALEEAEASAEAMKARALAIDELVEHGILRSPDIGEGGDIEATVESELRAIADGLRRRLP